jgi:RNA polymerase sigma-70 factor (ECF subfamily)
VREKPLAASDRELVSRAQKGDGGAFEELVHRYDRKVLSIALSFTRDPDDAKDVYQETFLRVYRALPGFEFGSEFSTWLHRIAVNVCLNHKQQAARRSFAPIEEMPEQGLLDTPADPGPASFGASPERSAEDGEIRRHVAEAVETLSPREKMAFTLRHYEGYRIGEIAEIMECGEGTVKRYLFTAVAKMRKKLGRVYR